MTNCYNCGHTGTFVLLVQFALAVPDSDEPDPDTRGPDRPSSESSGDCRPDRTAGEDSDDGGLSLGVQCPACDSTDVGVSAEDLLARYRSRTTS